MIRKVTLQDSNQLKDIYNYYINHSIATLEETEISDMYFINLIKTITPKFPWYVYEVNKEIIGFASASPWKERSGYKNSVQLSVYLRPNNHHKGIGTKLYTKVIDDVKKQGIKVLMGGISLPNEASVRLHEKFGFVKAAHFNKIGYKFNKWVDVGYWQLILNE